MVLETSGGVFHMATLRVPVAFLLVTLAMLPVWSGFFPQRLAQAKPGI
jgi:hypothetical protein